MKTSADKGGRKAEVKKALKPRATRATRATRAAEGGAPLAWSDARERIEWQKLNVADVRAIAGDALRRLQNLAYAGDCEAARELRNIACICVDDLERLVRSEHEGNGLRAMLRASDHWPVSFRARKKHQDELAKKMAGLGFATDCETNALGKWDEKSPATKTVRELFFHLISGLRESPHPGTILMFNGFRVTAEQDEQWREWVKANASKIPKRLTKENARKWADLTQPVLEIFWGKQLELHPDFALKGKKPKADSTRRGEILRVWRTAWSGQARHESSFGTRA